MLQFPGQAVAAGCTQPCQMEAEQLGPSSLMLCPLTWQCSPAQPGQEVQGELPVPCRVPWWLLLLLPAGTPSAPRSGLLNACLILLVTD